MKMYSLNVQLQNSLNTLHMCNVHVMKDGQEAHVMKPVLKKDGNKAQKSGK